MKNKYILPVIIILILFSGSLFSQPVPEWQRIPGIVGQFNALAPTADGGMVAAGYTYGPEGNADSGAVLGFHHQAGSGGVFYDAWVVKFSSSGEVEWGRCYGGDNGNEYANGICVAPDGGYVVAGSSESTNGDLTHNGGSDLTASDFWVFKIDTSGKIQWSENFGGPEDESANSIIVTKDNGYLVSGDSVYSGWVYKLNEEGAVQWYKQHGSITGQDNLQGAVQNADSGFTFAGTSTGNDGDLAGTNNTNGDPHFWLFNTDKNGSLQWSKVPYPATVSRESITNFTRCKDGTYALVGYSQPVIDNVVYFPEIFVMHTDSAGNYVWSKNYGSSGDDFGYCVVQDTDNNLIVGGYLASNDTDFPQHTNTAFLLKLSIDSGSEIWYQHYPAEPYGGTTDGTSSFQDLKWAPDSSLMAVGEFVKGQWKIDSLLTPGAIRPGYAVKFPPPSAGVATGIMTSPVQAPSFSVYPNPAGRQLHLQFSSLVLFPLDLQITNDLGQTVVMQKIVSAQQTIPVSTLPAGAYTCKVTNDAGYQASVIFVKSD